MTDFIEVQDGVPFQLDGEPCAITVLDQNFFAVAVGGRSYVKNFGDLVAEKWELVRPRAAQSPTGNIAAVLARRSTRYLTALAARDYINGFGRQEGPAYLESLFRSMGGVTVRPDRHAESNSALYLTQTARFCGEEEFTLFLQHGEDKVRRRELMALTIAVCYLEGEKYQEGTDRAPLDVDLSDARRSHPEAHIFAAMLLVPHDPEAPRSIDIPTAEEIGARLLVDPATVQDAYQLWHEITHPEQPKA